ncbi:MAG: hypothetical protein AAF941_05825 [Pseudomonadota bacterium]
MSFEPALPSSPKEAKPQADRTTAIAAARLSALAAKLRATIKAFRIPLFIAAALLFTVGLAISAARLDLALSDIAPRYILLSALIFIPLAFVYGAFNFMVMARGAGVKVPFARAFKVSCVAQFAEFLPIPGGAIVRGGALMQDGSGAVEATKHVMVNAVLWIACAGAAAAFSLGWEDPISIAIGLTGIAGITACTIWLSAKAGIGLALLALAMRVVGLFIAGARILAGFLAIGVSIEFLDLYPFVFATILGSTASIAPGGLGISEAVAAAIATLSTVAPGAAFVAVALNRLIGFAVSGIATGVITVLSSAKGFDTNG